MPNTVPHIGDDQSWRAYAMELERMNRELVVANEEALRLAQIRAEFLANMSHEIRTPMNVIVGVVEMLSSTALTAEQTNYLNIVRRAGQSLLQIVNDVLNLSQLENGRMPLNNVGVDLDVLLGEVMDLIRPLAADKKLVVSWSRSSEVPKHIAADPRRLEQVLLNLLGNAVKFTADGGVSLHVGKRRGEQGDELLFDVSDTGIGICSESIPSLFNRFTQADAEIAKNYGGNGLGLAISKQLVEVMGGKIWVNSKEGDGSVFSFNLPVNRNGKLPNLEVARPRADFSGRRILVVDDSPDNLFLVSSYLRGTGNPHIETAADGHEAIVKFSTSDFDVVLMDVQMPEVDGYTATRAIRDMEGPDRRTPIIALSAHALPEDTRESLAAGCDAHLSKPISRDVLLEALRAYIR